MTLVEFAVSLALLVLLALSRVLIQGYRTLGATRLRNHEGVVTDLFPRTGAVSVTAVWFMPFSTAIVV
jgi:hypothetical protein